MELLIACPVLRPKRCMCFIVHYSIITLHYNISKSISIQKGHSGQYKKVVMEYTNNIKAIKKTMQRDKH